MGGVPTDAARVLPYGAGGAGGAKGSGPAAFVGRHGPGGIGAGTMLGASSSNVRSTLAASSLPPVSESSTVVAPAGLTRRTSTSAGETCERPRNPTVTFVTVPVMPETKTSDGYGEACPLGGIWIGAELEKVWTSAPAGAAARSSTRTAQPTP